MAPSSTASKFAKRKDNRMSARFSVRPLRPADLDEILRIERLSFGKDSYDRNLFAEYLHKCGDLFLAVERGRSLCGYMITCTRGQPPGRAEIISIAVDPEMRGAGAGSALMDSTLRRLRRRPIGRLVLMVKVTNRAAVAFYEKYGFQKVRTVRQYYEDGADGWLMARNFTPPAQRP